jgi:hypothetical protein
MTRLIACALACSMVVGACAGDTASTTTSATLLTTTTASSSPTTAVPTTTLPPVIPQGITARLEDIPLIAEGTYAGPSWPSSLTGVRFVEAVPAPLRNRLLTDGFTVDLDTGHRHFSSVYESTYPYAGRPVFVTTDAAYHAWHLVFDKILRDTEEEELLPILEEMVLRLVESARAQEASLTGTDLAEPAERARQHLEAVATVLGLEVGPIGELATAEVALVEEHAQRTASPTIGGECDPGLFGKGCIDYSLMKPRGHYTRSPELTRFFKAMSMLGNTGFNIADPAALRVGLLVARLVTADPEVAARWSLVYYPTAFLVGAADDYTPFEAEQVAATVWPGGLSDPAPLADDATVSEVAEALTRLRPVLIDPFRPTLRTMGVRFVLDSGIYQSLVHPSVEKRARVSPLDLAATFGSDWALEVQLQSGEESRYPGYQQAVGEIRADVAARSIEQWGTTVYEAWLWALQPTWTRHGEAFPPFMRSDAWTAKAHQTGFGSYAELKHDTILYAKQAVAEGDMEPPPVVRHWVEPDPVAFARLAATASLLRDGLLELGLLPGDPADFWTSRGMLEDLIDRLGFLADVAWDELADVAASEAANERIGATGSWLATTLERTGADYNYDEHAALVADIFLDLLADEVLEVGTGPVHPIYVLVPDTAGAFQVATGAVYSYYEFWQPRSDRLTDEEWWQKIETGDLPERPSWVVEQLGR